MVKQTNSDQFNKVIDGYHVDIDDMGQLRVFGPNNHLYLGLPKAQTQVLEIEEVNRLKPGSIDITLKSNKSHLFFPIPLQCDVRTFREKKGVEKGSQKTFEQLLLNPDLRSQIVKVNKSLISLKRRYKNFQYGVDIKLPKSAVVKSNKDGFDILFNSYKQIELISQTDDLRSYTKLGKIYKTNSLKLKGYEKLIDRSKAHLKYLLEWKKTSSDRFGTLFPRDWMETADLGRGILTQSTIDYLYESTLKHVNKKGESWHEDVVGELEVSNKQKKIVTVNRDMIDLEPHHLIGLSFVSKKFLGKNLSKYKQVANFIVQNAAKNDLITFKKIDKKSSLEHDYLSKEYLAKRTYLPRGNWRDIASSYDNSDELMAPFDVNAVFYPLALKNILKFNLHKNKKLVKRLIEKWANKKKMFEFTNKDGLKAYSLYLYSNDFKNPKINHLDESYLYYLDRATEQEMKSFCQRLLSPKYFYTKSGPVVTAFNNSLNLNTMDYHGTVIWPKQTGFSALAIEKNLQIAKKENWSKETVELMKKALKAVIKDTLNSLNTLNGVPELYIDIKGVPHFFTDQVKTTEESSIVCLWSLPAFLTMVRIYKDNFGGKNV